MRSNKQPKHKTTRDFAKYFDREHYLFEDVRAHFHTDGSLGAFDFFSIIIWKANRAKSKIAAKLLKHDPLARKELEPICRDLTASLYTASDHPERLELLMKQWDFALPMASAILAVCWPDEFPVYDYRIRDQIGDFQDIKKSWHFERIWDAYKGYKTRVCALMPDKQR